MFSCYCAFKIEGKSLKADIEINLTGWELSGDHCIYCICFDFPVSASDCRHRDDLKDSIAHFKN